MMEMLKDWAKKNDVEKILEIHLELGEFTMFQNRNFRATFKLLSKGTVSDHAKLFIKKIPGVMACKKCGYIGRGKNLYLVRRGTYQPSTQCPKCKETSLEIVQGKEYFVREIMLRRKGSELAEKAFYNG
jgi:hydrogenase nickel insertion protein HypA